MFHVHSDLRLIWSMFTLLQRKDKGIYDWERARLRSIWWKLHYQGVTVKSVFSKQFSPCTTQVCLTCQSVGFTICVAHYEESSKRTSPTESCAVGCHTLDEDDIRSGNMSTCIRIFSFSGKRMSRNVHTHNYLNLADNPWHATIRQMQRTERYKTAILSKHNLQCFGNINKQEPFIWKQLHRRLDLSPSFNYLDMSAASAKLHFPCRLVKYSNGNTHSVHFIIQAFRLNKSTTLLENTSVVIKLWCTRSAYCDKPICLYHWKLETYAARHHHQIKPAVSLYQTSFCISPAKILSKNKDIRLYEQKTRVFSRQATTSPWLKWCNNPTKNVQQTGALPFTQGEQTRHQKLQRETGVWKPRRFPPCLSKKRHPIRTYAKQMMRAHRRGCSGGEGGAFVPRAFESQQQRAT